jgi:hypothetical protein
MATFPSTWCWSGSILSSDEPVDTSRNKYEGSVEVVDDHLVLTFGCTTHVVHTAREAGSVLTKLLKKELKLKK